MIAIENVNTFVTGVFPDAEADNSTGAATQDGFEFIAEYINNSIIGPQQAIMDYAGLTPDGVTEAAGASQMIEAIQKGNAVGPGWVGRRDIFESPAVNGDRSLLLSEQGVLIASYVDLDAATWIGGNTAAQIAAEAAGGKYYRSSDAGGAVGDAAGPYLQLPAGPTTGALKQYLGDGTDFTVAGTGTWSTTRAIGIPYQTIDGTWFLKLWATGTLTPASASTTLTIGGVTFKTTVNYQQPMSGNNEEAGVAARTLILNRTDSGASTIVITFSGNTDRVNIQGEFELDSKPDWADDFEPVYAITY